MAIDGDLMHIKHEIDFYAFVSNGTIKRILEMVPNGSKRSQFRPRLTFQESMLTAYALSQFIQRQLSSDPVDADLCWRDRRTLFHLLDKFFNAGQVGRKGDWYYSDSPSVFATRIIERTEAKIAKTEEAEN